MESIAYRDRALYQESQEWTTVDEVIHALIGAMSDFTGTECTELPPLNDYVDLEALGRLCLPPTAKQGDRGVFFHYDGYQVIVHSNGRIEIHE